MLAAQAQSNCVGPLAGGPKALKCGCGCGNALQHEVHSCRTIQGLHVANTSTSALAAAVLQVLWLADNQIRQVGGLATLLALRELNLAANPIATVGNAFVANTSLQQLNLADTHISSFKQVGVNLQGPGAAGVMLE